MLRIKDLNAFYGQSHILHDVSLHIPPGGRVSVLGRNGAGKTTLLKSITNSGPRAAGEVAYLDRMLGATPWFKRARLGIALVPEDRRIFTHITVEENIELAGFGASRERPALPVARILERFPMLQPLRERFGGQLSGGQQQMLAVARAIAARPRLLLLDEPTEGLAPVIVEELAAIVSSICAEEGISLLLVEQNIWFARKCTDRLYVLDTGRVVFEGDWAVFDANEDIRNKHLAVA
ncbi:ABC transporter ATP-binding protein [Microvirga antarctica]|uniref:ABC transporter ATP-binding protein n=1 Tax=Microvirga antarctica TaxID=2819233 RepID=UPI001B310876|nr:ABC transporter ATP-binding protein [Microvirga antarctica]